MKINLRESLNKIDLATDNKYDLLNTFDSKKLSDNSKKKLAEAIDNNSIASINRVLHESEEQLFKVVIQSGATKRDFESALYEDEAEGIVDYYGGRWIDENGFEWNMYVEEDDDSTEHEMVDNSYDIEYDDEVSDAWADMFDIASPQDVADSFKKDVKSKNKIYKPTNNESLNESNLNEEDYKEYLSILDGLHNALVKAGGDGPDDDSGDIQNRSDRKVIYLKFNTSVNKFSNLQYKKIFDAVEFYFKNNTEFTNYVDVNIEKLPPQIPQDRTYKVYVSAQTPYREDESLNEASYGGAYDIEDDMLFTKEEIVEFADEVCVYLEDIFGYQYNISDAYMDGPRKLYINIYDNNYIEVESTFDIDMRKIRKPSDLFKFYGLDIENWFQKAFAREYRDAGLDESLTEDMSKPDFVVGFYAGPVDDETLELVNPKKIAQVDVSADELRARYGKTVDKLLNDYTSQTVDKLKNGNSTLKAMILNFAEKKARETGELDNKFRNEERKFLETGIYMEKRLEEINYPFEDGIKKLSKQLGKKLLPRRENLNEAYRPLAIGYMILKKEIPNHVNYAEFANYDEVVTAIPSEADVVVYPRGGKISGTDIAYWQFDAIDSEGKKTKANFSTYIYSLKDFLNNDEMELKLIPDFKLIDGYPYLIEVDDDIEESLTEDTIKQNGKWVNKGSEGTHGKFRTKKAADAQRKAMFANGYKGESLNEQKYSSGNYFITVDKTGMGPHYSLYYQHPHSDYDGLMFIVDGYGYDNFKEKLSKFSTVYPNEDVQNLLKNIKKNVPGLQDESLKETIDDEIDLDYETDFDDNEVEEGNHVFADGEEYVWVERIAGPIYLDFDKWAVWSARVFVDPRDFMTIHSDGKNYDFDGDAFKEKAMAAPIVYFVVEEDTGFIDWGPEDNEIAAKDFLNGKQEDWDNDEYYGESLEKNLDEWYVHTIHYEDIGNGREYDYEIDHEEVLDYLSEIAIDEEDAPEDTEEYLKWVEDNFDELFNKYEYEIEEHFREDASQEEYNRRHSSYEP